MTQTITSTSDQWSGTGLALSGKKNEILIPTAGLPTALLTTDALRGYLLRIYDGVGEGQYRRIFESFVQGSQLVLATETPWDTLPGTASSWVITGYVAPPTVGFVGGVVQSVSADGLTIFLDPTGPALPTANGGLAGAIVRIIDGSGPGEYRRIGSNTAHSITVVGAWGAGTIGAGTQVAVLGIAGTTIDRVSALVADSDTPGVIVSQSGGSTRVVENGATDTYTVRLTRDPGGKDHASTCRRTRPRRRTSTTRPRPSWHRNNVQVTLTGADGVRGRQQRPQAVVRATSTAATGRLSAPSPSSRSTDGVKDGEDLQAFAPVARRTQVVQGPLTIIGGLDPDPAFNTSLDDYHPILMPDEFSNKPKPPVPPTIRVDETKQVDKLVVHNEDSPAADVGTLTSSRITGLGMAPDLYVAGRLLPGGITYLDLEALEILPRLRQRQLHGRVHARRHDTIDAGRGDDTITIKTLSGHTVVLGQAGDDTLRIGNGSQTVDDIHALLAVDGGAGNDKVYLNDSGDTGSNWATVTPTSVKGLDMSAGSDQVWVLQPGTADVVTLVVAGYGFLQFTVGRAPTTAETAAGMLQLTAKNLTDAIQHLIFPRGMQYIGPTIADDPHHVVTESDYWQTGCGALGTSDCAPSVWVQQVGSDYLVGFQGELKGGAAPSLQAFDLDPTKNAAALLRTDGLQYYGLEVLDITFGQGTDAHVLNVQGTGATSRTDIHLGAGDDRIFISSLADFRPGGPYTDFLRGTLDDILGTLNIDAGAGRQLLMISDEANTVGKNAGHHLGARDGTRQGRALRGRQRARHRRADLRGRPRCPRHHLPDVRQLRGRHHLLGRARRRHDRRRRDPAVDGCPDHHEPQHRPGQRRRHSQPDQR